MFLIVLPMIMTNTHQRLLSGDWCLLLLQNYMVLLVWVKKEGKEWNIKRFLTPLVINPTLLLLSRWPNFDEAQPKEIPAGFSTPIPFIFVLILLHTLTFLPSWFESCNHADIIIYIGKYYQSNIICRISHDVFNHFLSSVFITFCSNWR